MLARPVDDKQGFREDVHTDQDLDVRQWNRELRDEQMGRTSMGPATPLGPEMLRLTSNRSTLTEPPAV